MPFFSGIRVAQRSVVCAVLVRSELLCINQWSRYRAADELCARHKGASWSQGDELSYPAAVAGNCEGIAGFHRVHDFFGTHAEVTLADIARRTHVPYGSTRWHRRWRLSRRSVSGRREGGALEALLRSTSVSRK